MATPEWKRRNVDRLKKYRRRHYEKNPQPYIDRARNRAKELRAVLDDFKTKNPCSRCSETDPVCLDLHHVDRSQKELEISRIIGQGWSLERMMREIKKCIVLCANCHRKEHKHDRKNFKERGSAATAADSKSAMDENPTTRVQVSPLLFE